MSKQQVMAKFQGEKKKKIHAMEYLTSLLILYDSIFLHTSFMIIDSTLYSSIFFPRSADLPLRNTSWISLHKSILCKSKQTLPSLPAFKCTTFTYRRALKNSFKSWGLVICSRVTQLFEKTQNNVHRRCSAQRQIVGI